MTFSLVIFQACNMLLANHYEDKQDMFEKAASLEPGTKLVLSIY